MKVAKLEFLGETYHLFYSSDAMFTLMEEFGTDDLPSLLNPATKDGVKAIHRFVEVLSEQGELLRRHYGYAPGKVFDTESVKLLITPIANIEMVNALSNAIALGYGRTIKDEDKEVDLILQEIDAKKNQ